MCQLKNGCPGELWALYSIHTTIYKFLDFGIFRDNQSSLGFANLF